MCELWQESLGNIDTWRQVHLRERSARVVVFFPFSKLATGDRVAPGSVVHCPALVFNFHLMPRELGPLRGEPHSCTTQSFSESLEEAAE